MREADFLDFCTHGFQQLDRFVESGGDTGFETFTADFLDQADAYALQVTLQAFTGRSGDRRDRGGDGRGITAIVASDNLVQQSGVQYSAGARANLVKRGRHGDGAVAAHTTVRGLDAHGSGERARLADGTASISAEGERRLIGTDRRRGTAAGTARHAGRIPRVVGVAERGMLGRRALRELIKVGLAENRHAGSLNLLDNRGIVRRHPAFENLRGGGRGDALGDDHVLDRNRHAGKLRQAFRISRGELLVEGVGLGERFLIGDVQEGVDRGLCGLDDVEVCLGQFAAGDFFGTDFLRHLCGGQFHEFSVAHHHSPRICGATNMP